MKRKKMMAAFMAGLLAFSIFGCDKKENDPEKTTKATEEKEEKEEEPSEETSVKVTETTLASPTDDSSDGGSDVYGCTQSYDELDAAFLRFKQEAQAIHNNNDGRVLLFGFGKHMFHETEYDLTWEYTFLIYSPNDGLKAFRYNDGDLEEYDFFDEYNAEDDIQPEKFMLTYEDFMDFPAFYDSLDIYGHYKDNLGYDPSTYEGVIPDGDYNAAVLGLSGDLSYLYGLMWDEIDVGRSMEDLITVSEGDSIMIKGMDYTVDSIEFDPDTNIYKIATSDISTGYYIRVHVDEAGVPDNYCVCAGEFDTPTGENADLMKAPISPDCVIEIENYGILSVDEFQKYLEDRSGGYCVMHMTDGGFGFKGFMSSGVLKGEDGMTKNIVVKNGQIIYMSFFGQYN